MRYVVLINGDTELHLAQSEKTHKTVAYFFLHGVQEYYDLVKDKGPQIIEEIQDQPWGMREFEVADPDGNAVIFGESLERVQED